MTITGEEIRLEVGRYLNGIAAYPVLEEIINSGTSASQITDATRLASTRLTPQFFQDWIARVTSGTRDGDKVFARVLTPSTGVLTVSPSFGAALAADNTLELWGPRAPDPDDVDRARDRALTQRCTRWRPVPLSYAVDSDFIMSGITNWPGTDATPSKVTRSGLERFSEYALRVLNTGAAGYAAQTINCREGEAWHFRTLVQADVAEADFKVHDVSNSAEITLTGLRNTWTGEAFQVIEGDFTVPTGCEQISVRLTGRSQNSDTYWGPLSIFPQDAKEFVLPARIANAAFVGGLYELSGDDWPEESLTRLDWKFEIIDTSGAVRIVLPHAIGTRALFVEEWSYFAALQSTYNTASGRQTGDAATTTCPLEYILRGTLRELYGDSFEELWKKAHAMYGAKPAVRLRRDHWEKAYA